MESFLVHVNAIRHRVRIVWNLIGIVLNEILKCDGA